MTALIPLVLKYWQLIVGGFAVAILGVMLVIAKGDARHWRKADAADKAALNLELAKNKVNLASIDQLTAVIDAKNKESEARAKAYADSKAADAKDVADANARYQATAGRVAALEAVARVPGGNAACRVPGVVSEALEGL